ncbi:YCF48-related protein [Pleomorphovibrio marinus]|uniref:YCF48-related protein n=1 Tax=Pleomorphovibrio marinus TaxID=2164132 RepID=UPI000E0B70A0|nr:YCF48-related protein [Pleomorphovibrio marinus]
MRKIFFLGLLIFLGYHQTFSQSWRRVGNWGNAYSDVNWISSNVGYISGSNIFLKTQDGGLSWSELAVPTTGATVAMDFFDENNGIVLGLSGELFRTRDGAQTWQSHTFAEQSQLNAITYLSSDKILLSADNGIYYLSENGGANWEKHQANTEKNLNGLHFLQGTDFGFMVGDGALILKTQNGGQSWEEMPTDFDSDLYGVYAVNDTIAYAVGAFGTIVKTENAGNDWQFINSGIDTDLTNISVNRTNHSIAVISGKNGTVLRTVNAGLTFIQSNSRTTEDINAITFRHSSNTVFAVANSGFLISSNNSGASWSILMSGNANNFTGTHFTSDVRGYIIGENGLVLLTGNEGRTYTNRSRPLSLPFNALQFVTNNGGYVTGNNGNVISTTNSGANWTTLNPGTNRNINGLHFFNLDRGYIVGDRGFISHTVNRGVNWTAISSGESNSNFRDINFFDEENGIIVGTGGYIGRMEDGGVWGKVEVPTTADFFAIAILDDQSAIVVGANGTAYKTSDRGNSWQSLNLNQDEDFNDITFIDDAVGFITGSRGLMLRTQDAGDTWERQETGTSQHLTGISFGDLNVGYAVGHNGILLQYTCQVPEQPTTIFGEENICLGQQIYRVQEGDDPDAIYEWRVDGGTILEGQGTNRLVVRWDRAGRNAIMVRGQNNCGNSPTRAMEVVVSQQPDQPTPILGEGVVCLNSMEEFYVDSIPGTEYLWQVAGGVVRGGQGSPKITIEWTVLGQHNLTVSTRNPCGVGPTSEKVIKVLTVPNQPAAIQGPDLVGFESRTYEIPAVQDVNYQWALEDGGRILEGQGTNRVLVEWERNGEFVLSVTPMNACETGPSSNMSVRVDLITSIPDREEINPDIRIYPNPSQGKLTIETKGIPSVTSIHVYNAMGQMLQELSPLEGQHRLEMQDLPKGLHTIIIRSRSKEYVRKIWVK